MKTFNQIFGASLPTSEDDRKEFLANNCNHVAKEVGYSKAFTSVEVEKKRYELEKVSIYLEDKEEEKKEFNANWKDEVKPYTEEKKLLISELKNKATYVKEDCFAFISDDGMDMLFFNKEGTLVFKRPAYENEKSKSIFSISQTGTDYK